MTLKLAQRKSQAKLQAACADRPVPFNDEFDQTFFEGVHTAYGNVKSLRYYGNMQQRTSWAQGFIGVWQYASKPPKSDFKRIKDWMSATLLPAFQGLDKRKYRFPTGGVRLKLFTPLLVLAVPP